MSKKKAPEKKASAKKAPEKKTSAKKAPEKKASAKKAPEKKASAKKASKPLALDTYKNNIDKKHFSEISEYGFSKKGFVFKDNNITITKKQK